MITLHVSGNEAADRTDIAKQMEEGCMEGLDGYLLTSMVS